MYRACLLCFSGTYGDLLSYIMFAVISFLHPNDLGNIRTKKKETNMERPYKAFGYPVYTGNYILYWLRSLQ
jgi:APA family basic amino acid/polyamine antiporter